MKIQLPTFKELHINLKKLLWEHKPKTFEEWKNLASSLFCAKLGAYLKNNSANTKDNFHKIYQIMFYYGFINFRRELELRDLLLKNDYSVEVANMYQDAILGIDLFAYKNNNLFLLQVKAKDSEEYDFKRINEIALTKAATPVLAYKFENQWYFKTTNGDSVINLLEF